MGIAEQLAARAGRSIAEHDAAQRLVEALEREGLDRLVLGMSGREFVRVTPTMDDDGPREVLVIQPNKADQRGWVGPVPWSPKVWREGRAVLRGGG